MARNPLSFFDRAFFDRAFFNRAFFHRASADFLPRAPLVIAGPRRFLQ
jgi:hypothetical protein